MYVLLTNLLQNQYAHSLTRSPRSLFRDGLIPCCAIIVGYARTALTVPQLVEQITPYIKVSRHGYDKSRMVSAHSEAVPHKV